MANETSNITVNVDLKQAIADFELLDKNVDETRDSIAALEAQVIRLEKERANLDPKALNRIRDYNAAIDKTKQRLKEEKNDLKQLNRERTKAKTKVKTLTAATKGQTGATALLNTMTGGLVARFKAMQVAAMGAVKGLTAMKVALMATGIGLIVLAVTALMAAFKRSEEGQTKFSILMKKIGAVTGELLDALAVLGEFIIDVFTKPGEVWQAFVDKMSAGYQFIKKQVVNRLVGTFQIMQGKIEKTILKMRIAWKKFWGNKSAAKELEKQLDDVNKKIADGRAKLDEANNDIAKAYRNATESLDEYLKKLEHEQNLALNIVLKRKQAERIDRRLIVERAEATRKVAELREKAARKEEYSTEQRVAMLREAGRVEQEIVNKQIKSAELKLKAFQDEMSMGKNTAEVLNEEAKLKAVLINLEAQRLKKQRTISAEITTNLREQKARDAEELRKFNEQFIYIPGLGFVSREQYEKIKANGQAVQDKLKEFDQRREDEAAETEMQRLQLEEQRTLAELDRLNATEDQKMQIKKFYSDKYAEIDEKNKKKEAEIDQMVADQKVATAGQVFQLIGQIAKKGSKVGKVMAIGQTVISGIQAVQNAFTTASDSPISKINPGYPFQQALIAGAFSAAQLAKLIATNPESPSQTGTRPTGGGGNNTPAIPQFNIVGQGASSQLASAIADQEQQPVQAYVVSQDVTTAQSLENNIISGATLGG